MGCEWEKGVSIRDYISHRHQTGQFRRQITLLHLYLFLSFSRFLRLTFFLAQFVPRNHLSYGSRKMRRRGDSKDEINGAGEGRKEEKYSGKILGNTKSVQKREREREGAVILTFLTYRRKVTDEIYSINLLRCRVRATLFGTLRFKYWFDRAEFSRREIAFYWVHV